MLHPHRPGTHAHNASSPGRPTAHRAAGVAAAVLALAAALPCTTYAQARGPAARNQVTLEAGYLAAGVSYARRMGDGPVSLGAGAWGAWEPPNDFYRNIFQPIGVQLFARFHPAPWLLADVGPVLARYHSADDCSACVGTFAGVRSALLVGHGSVFVGPELSAGWARDDVNLTDFGVLYGAQARIVIGWGP